MLDWGKYRKVFLSPVKTFVFNQEKNIKFSPQASTREYAMFRTPLASVQKSAAQTLSKKDVQTKLPDPDYQKDSTYSRHNEFSEVIFCSSINQKRGAFIVKKDLE